MRIVTTLTRSLTTRAHAVAGSLPGVAGMGCAVAGVYLLAGLAWALIAAAPFLLILDWRAS